MPDQRDSIRISSFTPLGVAIVHLNLLNPHYTSQAIAKYCCLDIGSNLLIVILFSFQIIFRKKILSSFFWNCLYVTYD